MDASGSAIQPLANDDAAPWEPSADSPILAFLDRLHGRHRDNRGGAVATYIPELALADPDAFGICIATVDGAVYEVGDTRSRFTIQSISKPLTYAAVLAHHGEAAVRGRIGVEPTGEAFNSITLAAATGTPLNPMVNAGAIAAVGLVPDDGSDADGRIGHLLDVYGRFAGRNLGVDEAVFRSERDTGHRNRAIASLLRGTGALDDDPGAIVDTYFRQCSVEVDTRDLAQIAATLAAGGRHPRTGVQAASEGVVRAVLSVMASCGMYDGAGEWLFDVGLPAKSGVSGGIMVVLPGRLGIGVWSPPVDARGNSVRGVAVCRDLASELDLHLVRGDRAAGPIRTQTSVVALPSRRVRPSADRLRLRSDPGRSLVLELQGDLTFVAAATVARAALGGVGDPAPLDAVLLDLRRVGRIDAAVEAVLGDLVAALGTRGSAVAWSGGLRHGRALDGVDDHLAARRLAGPARFPELDLGLEWAEEVVLSRSSVADAPPGPAPRPWYVSPTRHPVLAGLPQAAVERLVDAMERRCFAAGETVVRRGDPADGLYLVTGGRLSVRVPVGPDESRRLATLEAGMLFGELAFLGGETRTANVEADTDVETWVLRAEAFDALAARDPAVTSAFLVTMLRIVAGIARRMTDEVALLAS